MIEAIVFVTLGLLVALLVIMGIVGVVIVLAAFVGLPAAVIIRIFRS